MTDTEQQIRQLCIEAKVKVLSVEQTAKFFIVTVAPVRIDPATVVTKLYRLMKESDTGYFSISYSSLPGQDIEELRFGAM